MKFIHSRNVGDISVIGQGTFWSSKTDKTAKDFVNVLSAGIDAGSNLIDTAEVYLEGESERIVSEAVKTRRDKIIISSKVSPRNLSPDNLVKSCEASLKRLGSDYIDIYFIHWPNSAYPFSETLETLDLLKKSGKIRAAGLSNFTEGDLQRVNKAQISKTIDFVQDEYNSFDRTAEGRVFSLCRDIGSYFMAHSPLDKGYIFGKIDLLNIAEELNIPLSQLLLSWNLYKTHGFSVPCSTSTVHAVENVKTGDIGISTSVLKRVDSLLNNAVEYVRPSKIKVVEDGEFTSKVYRTKEEALANIYSSSPSPRELADYFVKGYKLKPVRLRRKGDLSGKHDYDLIEGRIKYWGWVIAFGDEKKIPALIR